MTLVSPSELIPLIGRSQYISVDTEGTSIETTDLRAGTGFATGLSIACRPVGEAPREKYSAYFPFAHTKGNVSEDLQEAARQIIQNHPRVVYHNSKHDIPALKTLNIVRDYKFYDTILMFHWVYEEYAWSKYGLEFCANKWLGKPGKKKGPLWQFWLAAVGWGPEFPAEVMEEYAAFDTETTLELFEFIYPRFKKQGFDG